MTPLTHQNISLEPNKKIDRVARDPHIKALLQTPGGWNIPFACDRASTDFLISSLPMDKRYDRLIPNYEGSRNRKVPEVESPPLPIPGVADSQNPTAAIRDSKAKTRQMEKIPALIT